MNPANTAARFGLTELLVGVPFPLAPLEIVRHQAPVAAAKRFVFTADLVDAKTVVESGTALPADAGETVEQTALKWLRTATSRPLGGFAATKQVRGDGVVMCVCARDAAVAIVTRISRRSCGGRTCTPR